MPRHLCTRTHGTLMDITISVEIKWTTRKKHALWQVQMCSPQFGAQTNLAVGCAACIVIEFPSPMVDLLDQSLRGLLRPENSSLMKM